MPINTDSNYLKLIEECDFNTRAKNALQGAGIYYIAQLLSYSKDDLLEMRLIGLDTVKNITDVLTDMGHYKLSSIDLTEELKKKSKDFSLARMTGYLETYYPLNPGRSSLRNEGYSISIPLDLNAHFQLAVQQNPKLLVEIVKNIQTAYGDGIKEISEHVLSKAVIEQAGIKLEND